jgi:hypothetical protein
MPFCIPRTQSFMAESQGLDGSVVLGVGSKFMRSLLVDTS